MRYSKDPGSIPCWDIFHSVVFTLGCNVIIHVFNILLAFIFAVKESIVHLPGDDPTIVIVENSNRDSHRLITNFPHILVKFSKCIFLDNVG